MPQNYGFQNQSRQSLDDMMAALQAMVQTFAQQKQMSDAEKQARGFFQTPTTQMNVPIGTIGSSVPMDLPSGNPQPNISAMLSALFSANPYSQQNAKTTLSTSEMFQPKYQTVNQENGGLQLVTIPPFGGKPTFEQLAKPQIKLTLPVGFDNLSSEKKAEEWNNVYGANLTARDFEKPQSPTELSKYQNELENIRKTNSSDPRIPQYEGVIKRMQEGVPYYQAKEGTGGQYFKFNPKTGKMEGGTGTYSEVPEAVNMQSRSLADLMHSTKKIDEVLSRGSVGVVAGRARKLGTLFFNDEDQQALINYVGQLRPIIYGLSGKQINESEMKWLDTQILPKIEQPDKNFKTTLGIFNDWVSRKLQSMKEQYPGMIIPSSAGQQTQSGGSKFQILKVE